MEKTLGKRRDEFCLRGEDDSVLMNVVKEEESGIVVDSRDSCHNKMRQNQLRYRSYGSRQVRSPL